MSGLGCIFGLNVTQPPAFGLVTQGLFKAFAWESTSFLWGNPANVSTDSKTLDPFFVFRSSKVPWHLGLVVCPIRVNWCEADFVHEEKRRSPGLSPIFVCGSSPHVTKPSSSGCFAAFFHTGVTRFQRCSSGAPRVLTARMRVSNSQQSFGFGFPPPPPPPHVRLIFSCWPR